MYTKCMRTKWSAGHGSFWKHHCSVSFKHRQFLFAFLLCKLKEKYGNSIYFKKLQLPNYGRYHRHTFPVFLKNMLSLFSKSIHWLIKFTEYVAFRFAISDEVSKWILDGARSECQHKDCGNCPTFVEHRFDFLFLFMNQFYISPMAISFKFKSYC